MASPLLGHYTSTAASKDYRCLQNVLVLFTVFSYTSSSFLCFNGQPFLYMAFAYCVNVYMVSVHTSST